MKFSNLIYLGTILLLILISSCSQKVVYPSAKPILEIKQETRLKKLGVAFLYGWVVEKEVKTDRHLADAFVSHDLNVGGNQADFLKSLADQPFQEIDIIRVFEDHPFVFLHSKVTTDIEKVRFDILKFDQEKIVEHWSNEQPLLGPSPSGHTMIDGPVESTDFAKTADNKALAARLMENIFIKESGGAGKYFKFGDYVQHAPEVGDGVLGLLRAIRKMKKMGISIKYLYNDQILGEGNFVLSRSRGLKSGKSVAFYDLLQVNNGKFVEHWDVVAPIPMPSDWTIKYADIIKEQQNLWEKKRKKREKELNK